MKHLIFGKGWLGNRINDFLDESEVSDTDITDYKAVRKELEEKNPQVVINAAGRTGRPNIDWCEDHKVETMSSNVLGPLVLLQATQELSKYFVHLSSGCIYEGDNDGKGWSEEDPPNFYGSFYSKTKIWAEEVLREFPVLILRLRMPLDSKPSARNLLDKLLKYDKIISVDNSISVIDDLLEVLKVLTDKREVGIYNAVNPGKITHPELLDIYKDVVDPDYKYEVMELPEMEANTLAERSNCVLSTEKLDRLGIAMRPVREAVREVMEDYKKTQETRNNNQTN